MKRTIRLRESELKRMISESVKRVLNEMERSRPGDIPPGDEDIYYPGDINPDVWDALQRGDYGESDINSDIEALRALRDRQRTETDGLTGKVYEAFQGGEYWGDDNHGENGWEYADEEPTNTNNNPNGNDRQEEIAQGEELIKQHNQGKNMDGSYYIIGVTGQLQKYYTLYYFSKPIADFGRHNPFLYKGNLSQSFLSAVKKMIAKAPNVYIDIEPENAILSKIQKYKSEVFHSGKYQGLTYNEVYEKDPQYLLWIFNKLKEESRQMKKNPYTGRTYYLTKKQAEMYEILEPLIKTYHEEQIKSRRENIESEHITADQTRGIDFTVTNTPQRKYGQYGTYITVRGKNGNRYYIMNMKDIPNLNNEEIGALKGKTISIQSASTQPTEIYGVKYNKLSRVKGMEIH